MDCTAYWDWLGQHDGWRLKKEGLFVSCLCSLSLFSFNLLQLQLQPPFPNLILPLFSFHFPPFITAFHHLEPKGTDMSLQEERHKTATWTWHACHRYVPLSHVLIFSPLLRHVNAVQTWEWQSFSACKKGPMCELLTQTCRYVMVAFLFFSYFLPSTLPEAQTCDANLGRWIMKYPHMQPGAWWEPSLMPSRFPTQPWYIHRTKWVTPCCQCKMKKSTKWLVHSIHMQGSWPSHKFLSSLQVLARVGSRLQALEYLDIPTITYIVLLVLTIKWLKYINFWLYLHDWYWLLGDLKRPTLDCEIATNLTLYDQKWLGSHVYWLNLTWRLWHTDVNWLGMTFRWLWKSHRKSIGPEYLALKSNFSHMTADDSGMTN